MTEKNFASRSSMQVAFTTRLLATALTLFTLILTIKSELLESPFIAWQLSLSIPILFTAMVSNSKITNQRSFNKYKNFNLFINATSIALVANPIGLLVTNYISKLMGISYFLTFLGVYSYFFAKDFKAKKYFNEMIIIILLTTFGLIPTILSF